MRKTIIILLHTSRLENILNSFFIILLVHCMHLLLRWKTVKTACLYPLRFSRYECSRSDSSEKTQSGENGCQSLTLFNFMENMTLISDIMNNFTVLSELYTMNVYITQHFIHLMRFYWEISYILFNKSNKKQLDSTKKQ